ncbi:hypothetical protein GCM10011519_30190 [Marmoricola endophyticus]|uniref:Uncharacterized protein n=1 Tax=Marmoricola endophyticus TaxID=2040280 RepID=A0A917BPS2_9ACTN|nr:hypothetical protein [Marmoricola endophyticus]GGF54240.1 hypothetical protein GCM10011519_30190 [Marmoricola endophyticus]
MSTPDEQDQQGEVSEVSAMDPADADTPIQPDQATQGAPEMESGEVQTDAEAGPNARIDQKVTKKDEAPGQRPASER